MNLLQKYGYKISRDEIDKALEQIAEGAKEAKNEKMLCECL